MGDVKFTDRDGLKHMFMANGMANGVSGPAWEGKLFFGREIMPFDAHRTSRGTSYKATGIAMYNYEPNSMDRKEIDFMGLDR